MAFRPLAALLVHAWSTHTQVCFFLCSHLLVCLTCLSTDTPPPTSPSPLPLFSLVFLFLCIFLVSSSSCVHSPPFLLPHPSACRCRCGKESDQSELKSQQRLLPPSLVSSIPFLFLLLLSFHLLRLPTTFISSLPGDGT